MLEFKPFTVGHLKYLTPQECQRLAHAIILNTNYAEILETNFGLSAWDGPGNCVGAAGCVPVYAHRAIGWALLSDAAGPYMLRIVRKFRSVIRNLPHQRIEMHVAATNEAGHRFAKAIGMTLETPKPMRMSGANGEDEYLYSVVKWRH